MSDPQPSQVGKITVTENGPYQVTGGVPLVRQRVMASAVGEPIASHITELLETQEEAWLCRCGQSANKPYCDGSHRRVAFVGTETAARDGYAERAATMQGQGLVVRDDRAICEHAGFCSNKLTNVWKLASVEGDALGRAALTGMIERCPSGALTYSVDGVDVEPDRPVQIAVNADGPLAVTGRVQVVGDDGEPYELRNRMTLCRCGASANKPFCDGSHKNVGFTDSGNAD